MSRITGMDKRKGFIWGTAVAGIVVFIVAVVTAMAMGGGTSS